MHLKPLLFPLPALLLALLPQTAVAENSPAGRCFFYTALQAYEFAYPECLIAAEAGDAQSQFKLGEMYLEGVGTVKNYSKAMKWFKKAAEQGHAYAHTAIGVMYLFGRGVPQDANQSYQWLIIPAEWGIAEAQYFLGNMHLTGYGVPQDINEAYVWFLLAASQRTTYAEIGAEVQEGLNTAEEQLSQPEINAAQEEASRRAAIIAQRNSEEG